MAGAAIGHALDRPGAIRCFLLYGPDEAGSRALARRLATAMGPDAERIDLSPAQLKADPALLADEAAAGSLFGGARHIRVEGAGDESAAAVDALLSAPAAGNPVVLIAGPSMKKDARLAKLVGGHAHGRAHWSPAPTAESAAALAVTLARAEGLMLDESVAARLAAACNGDRAILAQEIAKLALFADAVPDRPRAAGHDMLDAVGADAGEADLSRMLDAAFGGQEAVLARELERAAAEGQNGVALARAALRRVLPMAAARAEIDRGTSPQAAIARHVWGRDRDGVARDLPRWSSARLAGAVERLCALERLAKSSHDPGPAAAGELLLAFARAARRR